MRFRNSLRLLMENFKHVYKILLYQLVVSLVATALCCAFVLPEIMEIWHSEAVQGLIDNSKAFVKAFLAASATDLQVLKGSIFGEGGSVEQIGALLVSMTTEIIWTCIGVMLVYLAKRFVDELFVSTEFFLMNYDDAKREFDACYNCISYVSELADHFGYKEYGTEIRNRFNNLLGVEEE